MSQFDVYQNPSSKTKKEIPYLVDVQSNLLADLDIRVVVPLMSTQTIPNPIKFLNPIFFIEKQKVIMSTAEIAGIPKSALGKKVSSLLEKRNEIIAALDFLFTGF